MVLEKQQLLANWHISLNLKVKVVLGAADTFRAAAVDQLVIWSERVGVSIVKQEMGSDPASVAFDTVQSAVAQNADVVIIDTAGRLHNKINLMNELSKIKRVMQKVIPDAPHEIFWFWMVPPDKMLLNKPNNLPLQQK
jgi:signal recognition particle GTPase